MKRLTALLVVFMVVLSLSTSAQIRVGGQAGLAVPMGDFGDLVGMGFGFHGLFVYQLQPQLELTGLLGYTTFGSKDEAIYADYSISTIPLLAGVRYSFSEQGVNPFRPYVGAELGLQFQSVSYEVDFGGFFGGRQEYSASNTEFCFAPQAGFYYELSPAIDLDVNLKLNIISDSNYLGVNAGILYQLP